MAQDIKYSKTQEKQYSAWITLPGMGVKIPGSELLPQTCKQAPCILYTAGGVYQPLAIPELVSKFRFSTGEVINEATIKAKMKNGVLYWTEVKRITDGPGAPAPVFARHIPGKSNDGLGYFMVCPDIGGYPAVANTVKVRGDVFVSTYNLRSFPNIATREQSAASVSKPTTELAVPKVAPVVAAALNKNGISLNSPAALLESQIRQAADILRKAAGVQVKIASVIKEKDSKQKSMYRGDIEYKFQLGGTGKPVYGELVVSVAVMESVPDKAFYRALVRGESYGYTPDNRGGSANLAGLIQPLVLYIQNTALAFREAYKEIQTSAKLLFVAERASDALAQKVAVMKYTRVKGLVNGYAITCKHSNTLFGGVTCTISELSSGAYTCEFSSSVNGDISYAAQALYDKKVVPFSEVKPDTRTLASAIVGGFGKIKKMAEKLRDAAKTGAAKNSYDYRLLGRGKNEQGETLYVLERLTSGAKTTMNRTQLIKLLEEKRVENAFVRWYKEERQIRLRGGGSLATVDVGGIRRSSVNRFEGAKAESEQLYSEVLKNLEKKGYTADGELSLTENEPLFGTFSIKTPEAATLTSMFSVTEWKYGVTDGGRVNLKGSVPEDKRRRSILASSLVSLILNAAKGAIASMQQPTAPIIPAQDDDFSAIDDTYSDIEELGSAEGEMSEHAENINAEARVTEYAGMAEDAGVAEAIENGEQDLEDAFANLESAAEDAFASLETADTPENTTHASSVLPEIVMRHYDTALNSAMSISELEANCDSGNADEISDALDEMAVLNSEFVDSKSKLEAILSDSPNDASLSQKVDELNTQENNITACFNRLENSLSIINEQQQKELALGEAVNEVYERAVMSSASINTRVSNTLALATVTHEELTKAREDMTDFKHLFDTSFETVSNHLSANPSNKYILEKYNDLVRRNSLIEENFAKLDEMINSMKQEMAAVPVKEDVAVDPFDGLGDDIETIFNNLPGEIVKPANQ